MALVSSIADAFITTLIPVALFAIAHTCLLLCALFIWSCRLVSSMLSPALQLVHFLSNFRTKSLPSSQFHPRNSRPSSRPYALGATEYLAEIATNVAALVTTFCMPSETDTFLDNHCPIVYPSTVSHSSHEQTCVICMENLCNSASVRRLTCAHMFHS